MTRHLPSYDPGRRTVGFAIVLAMHVVIVYALVTGLAQRVVERVIAPVEVRVVQEDRPPPPPIPPPEVAPPPMMEAPPPPFIPPPEVRVRPPPKPRPTITAKPVPPPEPAPMRPLPPPVVAAPAPAPPAAPPKPPPDLSRPARLNVARCEKPSYPRDALRAEATGVTRIRFNVDSSGRVTRAELLEPSGHSSAHRQMDRAAIAALSGCSFTPGADSRGRPIGAVAIVEYAWRID